MKIINEMAYSRADALERCSSLSHQFTNHFDKVVDLGLDDPYFDHHCHEMQTWFNDIKDIVLKSNNKRINQTQIIDWFFTRGSSYEIIFNNDTNKINKYSELVDNLLNGNSVKDSMIQILD